MKVTSMRPVAYCFNCKVQFKSIRTNKTGCQVCLSLFLPGGGYAYKLFSKTKQDTLYGLPGLGVEDSDANRASIL